MSKICYVCDKEIPDDAETHTDAESGEDVHAACCVQCNHPELWEVAECPVCWEDAFEYLPTGMIICSDSLCGAKTPTRAGG